MISNEKVIGVIYLESSGAAATLTEDDFELLTAIAGLGVIGIENARQKGGSQLTSMVGQRGGRLSMGWRSVRCVGRGREGTRARAIKEQSRKHQPCGEVGMAENLWKANVRMKREVKRHQKKGWGWGGHFGKWGTPRANCKGPRKRIFTGGARQLMALLQQRGQEKVGKFRVRSVSSGPGEAVSLRWRSILRRATREIAIARSPEFQRKR